MSLSRRSKFAQTPDELIGKLPNRPKTFKYVHVHTPGDQEYSLKAVHPILTPKTKALTFAAYNIYVDGYNSRARAENRKNNKHNKRVGEYIDSQDPLVALRTQANFARSYSDLNVWDFNQKVDAYNEKYGHPIIPKKRVQTIKQSTEKVFATMLWEYGHQLLQMKRKKEAIGQSYVRDVYKMEINTKHLENTKGEFGLYMLDYCPDTILNHKNRLIEAGILINSQYRGSERGTLHHISPKILVIFDDFDKKLTYSDNQLLRKSQPEVFGDTVILTRSINKPIIKRDVEKTSPYKDKAEKALNIAHPSDDSTRPPRGKIEKKSMAGPPNEPGQGRKIGMPADTPENDGSAGNTDQNRGDSSQHLCEKLRLPNELARELSEKRHENAAPIPLEDLVLESKSGNMSRSEFRELLIQDLFKQFSKMYRKHPHFDTIFPAVWYKSLKDWLLGTVMMNPNGHTLHKDKCLEHYNYFLSVFSNTSYGALSVARRTKFFPPIPTLYLNLLNSSPGTFRYHHDQVLKNHPKKLRSDAKLVEKQAKAAKQSVEYANHLRKMNRMISKCFNGKISDQQLFQYVRDNMPKAVQQDFHKHIENYKHQKSPKY